MLATYLTRACCWGRDRSRSEFNYLLICPTEKCHFSVRKFRMNCGLLKMGPVFCFGDYGAKESVIIWAHVQGETNLCYQGGGSLTAVAPLSHKEEFPQKTATIILIRHMLWSAAVGEIVFKELMDGKGGGSHRGWQRTVTLKLLSY